MQNSLTFCLKGHGYLQEVFSSAGKTMARIKVVHEFDLSQREADAIWLEAEVPWHLWSKVRQLHTDDDVLVDFTMAYHCLASAQAMLTPEDYAPGCAALAKPGHVVVIHGKLLQLEYQATDAQITETETMLLSAV